MRLWILIFSFFLFSDLIYSQGLSDPEKSFENFWQSYEDNYAFFNLYPLNWKQQYDIYRSKVTPKTDENELIIIFKEMLKPFNDNHSYILKGDSFIFNSPHKCSFDIEFSKRKLKDSLWVVCNQTLERNTFDKVQGFGPIERGTSLFYQTKSNNIGYIRISRCYGKTEALFDDNLLLLDSVNSTNLFDSLLNNMIDKKALIIDLRNNNGGNTWCYFLVSRFLDKKRTTYYLSTRLKGSHENFSELIPYSLEPDKTLRFLNPIVILTNCKTASAAEGFLIVAKELPNVTIIGSRTEGIFSNTMNYTIDESKNIWGTLSNQKKYDANKVCFEREGIPPDIEMYNKLDDLKNKCDPLILKAVEIIKK